MSATKAPPLIIIALVALLLYWVVQDPVGAAAMIRGVITWMGHALQLVAQRLVQFLNALN